MMGKQKEEKKKPPKQKKPAEDPMDFMTNASSLYKKPSKYGQYPRQPV
jgi:hypothetical protein